MPRHTVASLFFSCLLLACASQPQTVELKPMPVERPATAANQCTAQCNGRTLTARCEVGQRAECVCEPESFTRCRPAQGAGTGMVRVGGGVPASRPAATPVVNEPSRVDRLRGK